MADSSVAESGVIQSSLANYYRMIQRRVRELTEPLSTEQLGRALIRTATALAT